MPSKRIIDFRVTHVDVNFDVYGTIQANDNVVADMLYRLKMGYINSDN